MAGTLKRIAGPAYIANAAANIYTPPASTIDTVIQQIHIANVTGAPVTVSLYIGATGGSAGGTQLLGSYSIAANDFLDTWYNPGLLMLSTDFLSGVAGSASALVITVMGVQRVV